MVISQHTLQVSSTVAISHHPFYSFINESSQILTPDEILGCVQIHAGAPHDDFSPYLSIVCLLEGTEPHCLLLNLFTEYSGSNRHILNVWITLTHILFLISKKRSSGSPGIKGDGLFDVFHRHVRLNNWDKLNAIAVWFNWRFESIHHILQILNDVIHL